MLNKNCFVLMVAMFWMALAANAQQLPREMKGGTLNASRIFGDLNEDGEVNISDINLLIDLVLNGSITPDGPVAEHVPNMTIAEFKAKHWRDAINYADTITDDEVIHGWITSSDESGNIYKTLYITDESGAGLSIAINDTQLYKTYAIGQEIVLPLQGYWVGKYCGHQQVGYPQWYAQQETWEITFLPNELWKELVELNGNPDPSAVEPVRVNLGDFIGKTDSQTLLTYQSMLVRIPSVSFVEANGTTTYVESSLLATNRRLVDSDGNEITVRTSNYASFKDELLPEGTLDVVGELRYYRSTNHSEGSWQLFLRDLDDVKSVLE